MNPRTKATLRQLEEAEWFSKVGQCDTQVAIVLSSWEQAIQSCSSPSWENLCLEGTNSYCERLLEKSPARFNQWNEVVALVKPYSDALVQNKIASVVQENNLPKVFENTVRWDMLHVLIEAEYADVYPPGFYASQAYWYVKGHFPCGWDGIFPDGKLIIF